MAWILQKKPLFYYNISAINLTKNLVQYYTTKHIEIHHHFIRDLVNNGNGEISFGEIGKQLADLFTKALGKDKFNYLMAEVGIINLVNVS